MSIDALLTPQASVEGATEHAPHDPAVVITTGGDAMVQHPISPQTAQAPIARVLGVLCSSIAWDVIETRAASRITSFFKVILE